MSLRTKLLLALSPLLLALGIAVIAGGVMSASLGRSSRRIFDDNYRSVLAAQRMKEAVERIDSGALFIVLGESEKGAAQAAASRRRFEDELRVEETEHHRARRDRSGGAPPQALGRLPGQVHSLRQRCRRRTGGRTTSPISCRLSSRSRMQPTSSST